MVSLVAPVALFLAAVVITINALPAIRRFGPGFLLARDWNPVKESFGALPFIYGTVVTSFLALALALPIGVGVAIFLAEPRAPLLRGAIGVGVELLAAIPSVIYGIWGLYVLAPWLLRTVEQPLNQHLGFLGVFGGPVRQANLLVASLVLAVMVLPTLAAVSRDVVKAVPWGMREASRALGATWWETTWKVVLPAARPGIVGATILALGRALGETMAVTMTIGNRPDIVLSFFASAHTLASVIATEFGEATGQTHPSALMELGLVLILLTLMVNVLALLLVRTATREARA